MRAARAFVVGLVVVVLAGVASANNAAVQAACDGRQPTIQGTLGDDVLTGTSGTDVIDGSLGADTIDGANGDDFLCGSLGADTIRGGSGNDFVDGSLDPDTIDGGDGNDRLEGSLGADTINGGAGDDRITGGGEVDTITCGPGNDTVVVGTAREDTFPTGHGCETIGTPAPPPPPTPTPSPPSERGKQIFGTAKNDVLVGTSLRDNLYGKGGNDKLYGKAGDDWLDGGPGADQYFCGAGRDTAAAVDSKDKVAKDCERIKRVAKPKPKPKPTPTPAPPPTGKKQIKTNLGTLVITSVQLTDRFPPGCTLGTPFCDKPPAGYQILVVWLARADGGDPAAIAAGFQDAATGSYVRASDGSRGVLEGGGLLSGRLFTAYSPKLSARGFTLFWPNNSPIALGK